MPSAVMLSVNMLNVIMLNVIILIGIMLNVIILIAIMLIVMAPSKIQCIMEQGALKIVNNCLNTNIYSYLETSGGQRYCQYLCVVHFFNNSVN
jgi:hypothetical protein